MYLNPVKRTSSPHTVSNNGYDTSDSTDADNRSSSSRNRQPYPPDTMQNIYQRPNDFLFPPPPLPSHSSSVSSTANSTPVPSRTPSPVPQFYPPGLSSSCPSDTEDEPSSPLLSWNPPRPSWWREQRAPWWNVYRRRRRRSWRITRLLKRWLRSLVRHPFFPGQPITIVLTLILLSVFAILLTLLLIYILNPDKEPLPWRAYCAYPSIYNTRLPPPTSGPYPPSRNPSQFTPFPPPNLDDLPPAGIFLGIFSVDSAFERRQLVRSTWASHPRSREGAVEGDGGIATSRTIVRFVVGQPRKDWERRIRLEMEMYNDIIILPMQENMNDGKTHTFFSWASINAWVPPIYLNSTVPPPRFSYSNFTSSPPALAPHDPYLAWRDLASSNPRSWVRPDYVVKVDDDSFVMLAELEARLRVELHTESEDKQRAAKAKRAVVMKNKKAAGISQPPTQLDDLSTTITSNANANANANANSPNTNIHPSQRIPLSQLTDTDPLVYWGYLVTNKYHQFMAGELYALSWTLVDWVAKDPTVKTLTKGAEDKQAAKWMRTHPRQQEIRWASERCWIYDHPRSGTVYAHGFLFPSEVARVRRQMEETYGAEERSGMNDSGATTRASLDLVKQKVLVEDKNMPPLQGAIGNGQAVSPRDWAHSSVSSFGTRYTPPLPDLPTTYSVEALVEGSEMSLLHEGSAMTPEDAWARREGRKARYMGKRVGGTVVVHFIKKHMWFLETALAMLEGEEKPENEMFEERESALDSERGMEFGLGVEAEREDVRHSQHEAIDELSGKVSEETGEGDEKWDTSQLPRGPRHGYSDSRSH